MKVKLLILVTIPKRVLCIWFVPHNFRNPGPFGCVLPRIGETMLYFYALALKNSFFGIHSEYDSSRVVCGSDLERKGVC
jgi:hypothetical protein